MQTDRSGGQWVWVGSPYQTVAHNWFEPLFLHFWNGNRTTDLTELLGELNVRDELYKNPGYTVGTLYCL